MCHCSNCRKASGGLGNTILIVPRERFHWLTGEDHRVTYALRPTYTITRCKTCGTPLPAEEDERNIYVTAGTLDEPLGAGIRNHIFYGSRADWEHDANGARYFEERSSGPEAAPGPRLARSADMPTVARDVMQSNALTIPAAMPVSEIQHLFVVAGIDGAAVVDLQGTVVGVISAIDLLRAADQALDEDIDPGEADDVDAPSDPLTAEDIASPDPIWVAPDLPVDRVAQVMQRERVHRVLVGEGGAMQGILTTFDLLGKVQP